MRQHTYNPTPAVKLVFRRPPTIFVAVDVFLLFARLLVAMTWGILRIVFADRKVVLLVLESSTWLAKGFSDY